jgi:hypothetical protein
MDIVSNHKHFYHSGNIGIQIFVFFFGFLIHRDRQICDNFLSCTNLHVVIILNVPYSDGAWLVRKWKFWQLNIHTYMHACMHTYARAHTYTYMHTHIHTHTYIHTYIHTYVRIYIHTFIHSYIHTYIHTNIHTYIPTFIHSMAPQVRLTIGCGISYKVQNMQMITVLIKFHKRIHLTSFSMMHSYKSQHGTHGLQQRVRN